MTVGIDDLRVYVSTLAVEATEIGRARDTDPKVLERLKLVRRSLAPCFEDPITLAVNAARPVVEETGADSFGLLIVATESGVDYGKPLSSYVHRYLKLPTSCRNLEIKHACYAGTAAIRLASSWVESQGPEARALVVMTDIARKIFGDPAEPAEGAGAVAVVVSKNPRVLELDGPAGVAASEIYDVTRPTPTLERADAGLSLGAYLDLLEMSFGDYRTASKMPSVSEHFDAICYHAPLVPLVEAAHRALLEAADEECNADAAQTSFDTLVEPSLDVCREVGNLYGGSLYAAIAGRFANTPDLQAGQRIGLYSYGSGSCSEFFSATVADGAVERMRRWDLLGALKSRRAINFKEYETTVLESERNMTAADFVPNQHVVPGLYASEYEGRGLLVLDEVSDYYRKYSFS